MFAVIIISLSVANPWECVGLRKRAPLVNPLLPLLHVSELVSAESFYFFVFIYQVETLPQALSGLQTLLEGG